jgi:hypothetical protein
VKICRLEKRIDTENVIATIKMRMTENISNRKTEKRSGKIEKKAL